MSAAEYVPFLPFQRWIEDRIAAMPYDRFLDAQDGRHARLARLCNVDSSQLTRWRIGRGDGGNGTIRLARVEDVVDRAGDALWQIAQLDVLYADQYGSAEAEASAGPVTAYCPNCREQVVPNDDGTCVWCDSQTGGVAIELRGPVVTVEPDPGKSAREIRTDLAEEFSIVRQGTCWGTPGRPADECSRCHGTKSKQAFICRDCWRQVGTPRLRRKTNIRGCPRAMTEEQLLEARRRYVAGESYNVIAKSMLPETGYASWRTLSSALCRHFKARGWPSRDRIQATVAASTIHGLKRRSTQRGYSTMRNRAAGNLRTCRGTSQRGKPCRRWASHGSDYCYNHDERTADEAASMAKAMYEGRSDEITVPRQPFADWLEQLYAELGSWTAVGEVVGKNQYSVHQCARPQKSRGYGRIQIAAVERMLATARSRGHDVTLESLYPDVVTDLAAAA